MIGSGPAGVACAKALLARGVPVTLLDAGVQLESERMALLDELAGRHAGERIVLFGHSGTIDAAARWAFGLAATSPWQHDLPVSNGSITELELWPRGRAAGAPRYTRFRRIGDTSHLADRVSGL